MMITELGACFLGVLRVFLFFFFCKFLSGVLVTTEILLYSSDVCSSRQHNS